VTSRISGEHRDIDESAVRRFFSQRAARAHTDTPLTAVLYQDQAPDLAEERDRFERRLALPLLRLTNGMAVLDVGCGIGRWASDLLEHSSSYCGVDFSEELLEAARARVPSPKARFVASSMVEMTRQKLGNSRGFERVLLAGVMMYVNDEHALATFAAVERCSSPASLIYVRDSTAVAERLTLDNHWSDDLGSHYSAVYRTRSELLDLMAPTLLDNGFRLIHEQDLYPQSLNNRNETTQRIYLLERT
jgi:cyclopropane fatty-acyl-phospholipid synthase-like methyltransferase